MPTVQKQSSQPSKQNGIKHKLVEAEAASGAEKIFNQAQQAFDQVTTQGSKLYEQHVEPSVGPALKFISQKHHEHPEFIQIASACVALLYGGCFPHLVLLYALSSVMDDGVFGEVLNLWKLGAAANGNLGAKLKAMFSKSDPATVNNLMGRLASKLCVVVAILMSPVFGAIVMGNAIVALDSALLTFVTAKVKKSKLSSDEGAKWAPVASKYGLVAAVGSFAWLFPYTSAAILIGFEGGMKLSQLIAKMYLKNAGELQIRYGAAALAGIGIFLQWWYSFAAGYHTFGLPVYLVLYPFFVVERML